MTNSNINNKLSFTQWLKKCPVSFSYLDEDKSDGQIAYVFYINDTNGGGQ